jgi:catalase
VENAGVPARLPSGDIDPGLFIARQPDEVAGPLNDFVAALSGHRAFARELDPPGV